MAKEVKAAEPVEEPWALPDGWRWEALGSLGTWSGGGTPSKARPDFWTGGTIPWVSPKDMKRPLIDSSEDSITVSAVNGSSARMVAAGSVLCVMRSGILRHTFPVAVNTVDVTLNQDMRALKPRSDVEPRYLSYYLRFTGETVLHTASKAGTTVNSIETSRLDRHPVPLTDVDRQRAIVARIDQLFAEIEDGEAALARARGDLATWRKALLKAAVTGELTADWRAANLNTETGADLLNRILAERRDRWDKDVRTASKRYVEPSRPIISEVPELPDGWTWVGIEELTTGGIRNGLSLKEASHPTGVKGLKLDALQADGIDWSRTRYLPIDLGRAVPYLLRAGDLLISRANGSAELLGRCTMVEEGRPDTVFPDTAIRYPIVDEPRLRAWAKLAWSAPLSRKRMLALAKSTAGILKISQGDIAAVALPLPPLAEIDEIVDRVERVTAEAEAGADDLSAMTSVPSALRQSILAAAFRGELS
jgi:type I restriction enzyme, S subunit